MFFRLGNVENPTAPDIAIARTAACTTLIFTQLATCWQALRYPWEPLVQRVTRELPSHHYFTRHYSTSFDNALCRTCGAIFRNGAPQMGMAMDAPV